MKETVSSIAGPSGLRFVVHPLPGSAEQLTDKLRQVGDRLRNSDPAAAAAAASTSASRSSAPSSSSSSANASTSTSSRAMSMVFSASSNPAGPVAATFSQGQAVQIEVGPSHFAFLLDDGRVCRLPFSVISDRLDLNKSNPANTVSSSNNPNAGGSSVGLSGSSLLGSVAKSAAAAAAKSSGSAASGGNLKKA